MSMGLSKRNFTLFLILLQMSRLFIICVSSVNAVGVVRESSQSVRGVFVY